MKHKTVSISNVRRLVAAGQALINRAPNEPGMGLIHGPTGAGKSTATAYYVNQCDGVYVRATALWVPSAMLGVIQRELDLHPRGSNAAQIDVIVESLARSNRPLFVDEADYLVDQKRMVETLRDLHDLSTVPVILIGMEGLQRKIMAWRQLAGRIAQWVKFAPATLEDAEKLARELCEVEVDRDLVAELHAKAAGSVRLICVGLSRIEHGAKARGLRKMSLAEWGARKLFLGDAAEETRSAIVRAIRGGEGE